MNGGAFLYSATGGFCLGVGLALLFVLGTVAALAFLGLAVVVLLFSFVLQNKYGFILAVALAAMCLGIVRVDLYQQNVQQETVEQFANQKVSLDGTVVNDPDVVGYYLQTQIAVAAINTAPAKGVVLAFLPPDTQIFYGDTISLTGMLRTPEPFMGEQGNTFDYPGYLRAQGVAMTLNKAQVQSVEPAGVSLLGALYFLKQQFNGSIERLLPHDDAVLLEGILLGERHGLSQALTQAFVAAGLIHIIILSGYSMSVVSEGVLRSLAFLPKRSRYALGGALMILFVALTGAAATTVRACAMAIVALVARYFHRTAVALRSLAVVAAAMVLWNPELLPGSASFIVSVLATFGLIVFSPQVERALTFITEKFGARSIITSTFSVQIFALPALLYFTGNISFLSLPANVLVLPLLPLVMLLGFLSGALGFISPVIAFAPAASADILLRWILLVVAVVKIIPFSSATVYAFPLWGALLCYMPLTAWAIFILLRFRSVFQSRSS